MATFRSGVVSTTGVNVKTSGADVLKVNIVNRHSAVVYVKFYNSTVSTFQDVPIKVFAVPATSSIQLAANFENSTLFSADTGLSVRATTDSTDNGNTAAGTLPIIEIEFK